MFLKVRQGVCQFIALCYSSGVTDTILYKDLQPQVEASYCMGDDIDAVVSLIPRVLQ